MTSDSRPGPRPAGRTPPTWWRSAAAPPRCRSGPCPASTGPTASLQVKLLVSYGIIGAVLVFVVPPLRVAVPNPMRGRRPGRAGDAGAGLGAHRGHRPDRPRRPAQGLGRRDQPRRPLAQPAGGAPPGLPRRDRRPDGGHRHHAGEPARPGLAHPAHRPVGGRERQRPAVLRRGGQRLHRRGGLVDGEDRGGRRAAVGPGGADLQGHRRDRRLHRAHRQERRGGGPRPRPRPPPRPARAARRPGWPARR